ncbi:MAG: antibiotic biosynthesis monooxygenase [Planctomycetia bacterium]|nr:MAG: antibiotic biosynthesis monooxygenase [Planctomycetia bacterium]
MVTVGMNYDVLPGRESDFETVFAKVLDVMRAMPGHTDTHLYRDVARPGRYLILSEWSDQGAFEAFTRSDRFRAVTDWGKSQILAGRPRHEIYTPGGSNPGAGPASGAAPSSANPAPGRCPVHPERT